MKDCICRRSDAPKLRPLSEKKLLEIVDYKDNTGTLTSQEREYFDLLICEVVRLCTLNRKKERAIKKKERIITKLQEKLTLFGANILT